MRIHKIFCLFAALIFAACTGATEKTAESPSATVRQYVEAANKQDVEAMKKLISRNSLALMDKSAKAQSTTVEDLLKRGSAVRLDAVPETRNEKIEGDTATVEVKNVKTGEFDVRLPFVKEDGAWKIAIDKYVEEMRKKLTEDMNKPPANVNSGSK